MAMKTDTMVIMIGSVYYKMQSECFNSILHVGLAFICIKMIFDYNRPIPLFEDESVCAGFIYDRRVSTCGSIRAIVHCVKVFRPTL